MGKKVKYISALLSYVLIVCLIMGLFPAATFAKNSTQMTEAKKPTKKTVSMTEVEKPQNKKTMQVTDVETQKTHEVEIEQPKKDQKTETTTQTMQQTTTVNNVNDNIVLTENITHNCDGTHNGWKELSAIPTTWENEEYYLASDLIGNITIPADKKVVLCLRGNTLTGNGGSVVTVNGDFTLCDCQGEGKITGGNAQKGGGVYVNSSATFTMNGGSICNNEVSDAGGGVYIEDATFTMNGDSKILENKVLSAGNIAGGGVYVENGTFTMNDNSEIRGNRILNENPDSTHWTNSFGGGAYIKDSTFTMNDTSTIQFNQTDLNRASCSSYCYGGGVYVDNSIFAITGSSSITGNRALPNIPAIGGGAYVKNSTFTMSDDSTISNNEGNSKGGGVFVQGGEFTMTGGTINHNNIGSGTGGGVAIEGNDTIFTMENGTISNNSAAMGGGIAVSGNNTTFTMENGTISGNTVFATHYPNGFGGGVYIAGNDDNPSTFFNMEGGTISDNKTSFGGGGVAVLSGEFTMTGGTISDNSVNSNFGGGGVYVNHSIFNMTNSTISNNTAGSCDGGGVSMGEDATFDMIDSTISGNTANRGGGISIGGSYLKTGGTFTMTDSIISDNTADNNAGGVAVFNGTFTMRSGSISNNSTKDGYGGGVSVIYNSSKFTMNGGEISGNTANSNQNNNYGYGGGVFVGENNKFIMTDGTIKNNTSFNDGGGVYLDSRGDFSVSGDVLITDNNKTDRQKNNVYLENIAINIIGALKEMAEIGVTVANPPTEEDSRLIAESYSSYNATVEDKERFASDNPKYKVIFGAPRFIYLAVLSGDEKTITFDYLCDDIENEEVSVDAGDTVEKPIDPIRNGFIFGGWYTDENCTDGNEWNFSSDVVTGNMTLYAKWTENAPTEYTVTFVIEDLAVANQTVQSGQKVTEPTLSRDDYTLDGWYTDEACTARNKWDFGTPVIQDLTLYAKWEQNENPTPQPEQFTVEFDSQGGSTIASQTVTKNGAATKPADPTKEGYTFEGWFADDTFTLEWIFSTPVLEDLVLYAKWKQNETPTPTPEQFTVIFDSQGGSEVPSQAVESGKTATMPETPIKKDCEFLGWFVDKEFNEIYRFSIPVTKNITLYAKWTEKKIEEPSKPNEIIKPIQPSRPVIPTPTPPTSISYTVTFDSNGGSKIASQTMESGKTATVPETPTKNGYIFLGWFIDKDFKEVYRFSTPVIEDITLYAKWKEKSYSSGGSSGSGGGSSSSNKNDEGRTGTWIMEESKVIQPVAQYQVTNPDCPRDETCPLSKFIDVNKWAWYHDGSHYCVEHDLIVGTSNDTFSPDMSITRGMVVAILWRMEDKPVINDVLSFQDVKETAYYAEAVRWAAHNNIVSGYSNTKFGPNDDITREQITSVLYRYTQYKGNDVSKHADISKYEDSNDVSNYAIVAMQWACNTGIINGINTTLLSPKGTTTRAQAAQMFYMDLKK